MNIAICDDCFEDALSLKAYLHGQDVVIYSDVKHLLADVEEEKKYYDLYVLDIYIDDTMNGIELARRIRSLDDQAFICFISSSDAFYREAYDLYAIQYLLKPVQEDALKELLERVRKSFARNKEQKFTFRWRGQSGFIPYSRILYISSREHSTFICCTDGKVQECKGKLSEIALQICGDVFLRCHQSFIVNMYQVDSLNRNDLMVSGQYIPVSRRYYAEVKKRYSEILFEGVG